MSLIKIFLVVMFACLVASEAVSGQVILTSGNVNSATDIERAIEEATHYGSEKGLVTLDGAAGDFVYNPIGDRSINIYISNFTLQGINGATISNCEDGLFFAGDTDLSKITVRNLRFICDTCGIREGGPIGVKKQIRIENNHFDAIHIGIVLGQMQDSSIVFNTVSTEDRTIVVAEGSTRSVIAMNNLSGFRGIEVLYATHNRIYLNSINVDETGVLIQGESSYNSIIANYVYINSFPGISLQPDTYRNKVLANRSSNGDNLWIEDLGTDNWIH